MIFERFIKIGSATELVRKLRADNVRGKQGKLVDKGSIYKLLNNRVYIGEAVHKGVAYQGEHQAIIDRTLWDRVHAVLRESPRQRAANTRNQTPALLRGLIFGPNGKAMTPTMTKKGSRLYRYYVSTDVIRGRVSNRGAAPQRLPAGVVEAAVIQEIRTLVRTPEIAAQTIAAVREQAPELSERDVIAALNDFDALWGSLFPAEQARIVYLMVQRVSVSPEGVAVDLRAEGLRSVIHEMIAPRTGEALHGQRV
jgi:hypothetical protein